MVMVKDKEGVERYSISTDLHNLVEIIKNKIHEDDSQCLGIIFGKVGEGKSLFAMRLGYAIDPSFTDVSRVCFNKDEFIEAVLNSKKQVIIGDEGISLFFSRSSMTKEGRLISELMDQIRQKNLVVLVCVPKLLTLDWTIIDSANFVIYVWESAKRINGRMVKVKGNAAVFPEVPGYPLKSLLVNYMKAKRRNPMYKGRRPDPAFHVPGNPIGETFAKPWYPVDETAYRAKKEAILNKYKKIKEEKVEGVVTVKKGMQTIKKEVVIDIISKLIQKEPRIPTTEIAKRIGYSVKWTRALRKLAEKRIPSHKLKENSPEQRGDDD